MTELRLWRRHHSPNLVAEVAPVPGMGTWTICAWRGPERLTVHQGGQCQLLTDAHRQADALSAAVFDHRCDAYCGVWQPVERRAKPR